MVLGDSLIPKEALTLRSTTLWLVMKGSQKNPYFQTVPAWQQSLLNHLRKRWDDMEGSERAKMDGEELVGMIQFPETIRESTRSDDPEAKSGFTGCVCLYGDGMFYIIYDVYKGKIRSDDDEEKRNEKMREEIIKKRIMYFDMLKTRTKTSQDVFDTYNAKKLPKEGLEYRNEWMGERWNIEEEFPEEFRYHASNVSKRGESRKRQEEAMRLWKEEQERKSRKDQSPRVHRPDHPPKTEPTTVVKHPPQKTEEEIRWEKRMNELKAAKEDMKKKATDTSSKYSVAKSEVSRLNHLKRELEAKMEEEGVDKPEIQIKIQENNERIAEAEKEVERLKPLSQEAEKGLKDAQRQVDEWAKKKPKRAGHPKKKKK